MTREIGGGEPSRHAASAAYSVGGHSVHGHSVLEVNATIADKIDGLFNLVFGCGSLGLSLWLLTSESNFLSLYEITSLNFPWFLFHPVIWIMISFPCLSGGIRQTLGDSAFSADATGISYTYFGYERRRDWTDVAKIEYRAAVAKYGGRFAFPDSEELRRDKWYGLIRLLCAEPYSIPVLLQQDVFAYRQAIEKIREGR